MEKDTPQKIAETITLIQNLKNSIEDRVKETVRDKNFPLEDRWNLFTTSEMGCREPFQEDFKTVDNLFGGELSWYDDFYIEGHETLEITRMIKTLEDKFSKEQVDDVKEEILEKFIYSFELDW